MADPVTDPAAPAAVVPESAPAPVAAAPEPAPAAVPQPELPLAPAEGAKPAEVVPEAPKTTAETPSLLEEAGAKPEGEKKPGEEPKPADQPKTEEPAKPLYEFKPYQLPEGFKADDTQIKAFNDVLVKPDLDPQARGQELVNLHVAEMTKYLDMLAAEQQRVWLDTRKGWRDAIKADPEIGGAGYNTTMQAGARMRDLFVPESDRKDFNAFLRITGAGDHPAFWRMLNRVARIFDEPSPPPPAFKPPADIGKKPGGSASDRLSSLYDHERSVAKRG